MWESSWKEDPRNQRADLEGSGIQLILSQRGTELKMGNWTQKQQQRERESQESPIGKLSARGGRTSNCPIVPGASSCGEMSLC